MEHYTPSHPLPEEIQTMKRDETVCQFCGVSYLIHNEIKALELKLEKAEMELEKLRGQEAREEKLKADLELASNETNLLKTQLSQRDTIVSQLQSVVTQAEDSLRDSRSCIEELKQKTSEQEKVLKEHREENSKFRHAISVQSAQLVSLKEAVGDIRSSVTNHSQETELSMQKAQQDFITAASNLTLKLSAGQSLTQELSTQLDEKKKQVEKLSSQLTKSNQELSTLNSVSSQLQQVIQDRDKALSTNKDLSLRIEEIQVKYRQLNTDLESVRSALSKKTEAYESVSHQLGLSQRQFESQISSLSEELSQCEKQSRQFKKKCESLIREQEESRQLQNTQDRMAAQNKDETDTMRARLERALGDLEAFKNEREQMITAHHNRIEDLRESFKRKMSEADKWPAKMESALQKERSRHQSELSSLEHAMKESFVMEMQIEKQKHQELLDRNTSDLRSEISKLKTQIRTHTSNQSELETLRQQLKTLKADSYGNEARLRSEVESLKSIISNLENKLGKLDSGDKELTLKLKSDLSDKERVIEECQDRIKSQSDEISQLKDQLRVLQDTVSRECEERMELIDALEEAREQLLLLKKPTGGYGSRNASPKPHQPSKPSLESATTPTSNRSQSETTGRRSSQSEELMLFRRSNQATMKKSPEMQGATTNTNVKNLDFRNDNSKSSKPFQALKAMDPTQKKRIAAILSRDKQ